MHIIHTPTIAKISYRRCLACPNFFLVAHFLNLEMHIGATSYLPFITKLYILSSYIKPISTKKYIKSQHIIKINLFLNPLHYAIGIIFDNSSPRSTANSFYLTNKRYLLLPFIVDKKQTFIIFSSLQYLLTLTSNFLLQKFDAPQSYYDTNTRYMLIAAPQTPLTQVSRLYNSRLPLPTILDWFAFTFKFIKLLGVKHGNESRMSRIRFAVFHNRLRTSP